MKNSRKVAAVLLAALLASTAALSGCSGAPSASSTGGSDTSKASESNANSEKEEVELTFYTQNSPVKEFDRIMEKANQIIKEKINAKLNLVLVDGSTYAQKMNMVINGGEAYDLCFTGNWGDMNYFQNAANGAYLDITDLIKEHAPESYSRIPESLWDGVKVKGKIYGIVNYQQWGISIAKGVGLRKDLADEFGFDWKSIKKLADVEPFLEQVKSKYPDMIPYEYVGSNDTFANNPLYFGMDAVGDSTVPGWVGIDDGNKPVVVNQYETDAYKEFLTMARRWFEKGYVRSDAATLQDFMPDRQANRVAVQLIQGYPDSITEPDQIPTQKMSHTQPGDAPAVTVSLTDPFVPSGGPATAVTAVGANSNHPERALELVELLNTNDELFTLITLGEEGTDWKYAQAADVDAEKGIKEGDFIQIPEKYNYNWMEWALAQSYSPTFTRANYNNNESGDLAKKLQQIVFDGDKTAKTSPVMGFTFDTTNVKTEIANCSAVIAEMVPALGSGSVDPETKLPEFLDRLKTAGVDKIIAEKQSQIDAWLASK